MATFIIWAAVLKSMVATLAGVSFVAGSHHRYWYIHLPKIGKCYIVSRFGVRSINI